MGDDDNVLELLTAVHLPLGPQQDLAALGLHGPPGQIERRAAHRVRHLPEAEAVAAQRLLRNLDGDFVAANARDLDLRDLGHRGELVTHPLGEDLEGLLRRLTGEDQRDHPPPGVTLRHHRFFGLDGEGHDAVHRRFDVVQNLAVVGVLLELGEHGADALAGHRSNALDALDGGDGLLDPDAHPLLDLGR